MENLLQECKAYMEALCLDIPDRSVGSKGNRAAAHFFEKTVAFLGWDIETQEFEAMDWIDGGASLFCDNNSFQVYPSPYSTACETEAQLVSISSIEELEPANITGKLVFLNGEIAKEQLMPKNFVFYNPPEHQHIISMLEKGGPRAIICATGRNAALAGGVYPFPLIEDGDFDIPSVYMTDGEGRRLAEFKGRTATLKSISKRVPGSSCNVIARKGSSSGKRIVITAHIDAKKGTPGAIDNATGVVILLFLAQLLNTYNGEKFIEIVALNGEDYYAVPGQMMYLNANQEKFHEIALNINIDGAGYKEGRSAFSFYGLPADIEKKIREVILNFSGLEEGPQWVQGDHSIFIQSGCPALAVTSQWFSDHIDNQDITHTPKDNLDIVDCVKLVEIARALNLFIRNL